MTLRAVGPTDAKIMLVGEAPGEQEVLKGEPFVGYSGQELTRMLHEAGISRAACFITNACRVRPPNNKIEVFMPMKKKEIGPQHSTTINGRKVSKEIVEGYELLRKEIELVKPNVIVAFGNVPLWALTGRWGIGNWRGSLLALDMPGLAPCKVVATYHPAAILRQWTWRAIAVHDLRRALAYSLTKEFPVAQRSFLAAPTIEQLLQELNRLYALCLQGPLKLAVDVETRLGHMSCIGLAWSKTEALCIPLMRDRAGNHYWSEDEEVAVLHRLYLLLTHPNCHVVGQNFLYDAQYFYRWLHYVPNCKRDTMIAQHACWSNMEKALDFLASMYCENYVQWKPEKVAWKDGG